jgi:hypothetical protein
MAKKSLKIIFYFFLKKHSPSNEKISPEKNKEKKKGSNSGHKLQHIQFAIQN